MFTKIKMNKLPEILNTSIITKTDFFRIEKLQLRFSNGEERFYERMLGREHGAVLMVPVLGEDLLLVREYCAGTHRYELGFPKGRVEDGEGWEAASERELREEVGYKAGKYTFLRSVNSAPSFFRSSIDLVLAEELIYDPLKTGDEPEPLEIVKWPVSKTSELLVNPEFQEARCLVALALAKELRHWQ